MGRRSTSNGNDKVIPISTATNRPGKPVQVPGVASNFVMVMNPDGKTVYITAFMDYGTIIPVSMATNTVGKPIGISLNDSPPVITFTPDGKTAYVGTKGDTVTPVNTATNTPGKPINVGINAASIAVTPDGKTAYVTGFGASEVVPFSTVTNTPGKPIRIGTRLGYRDHPGREDRLRRHRRRHRSLRSARPPTRPASRSTPASARGKSPVTPDGKTAYASRAAARSSRSAPSPTRPARRSASAMRPRDWQHRDHPRREDRLRRRTEEEVVPISTATNTPGTPIRVPYGTPDGAVITPRPPPVTARGRWCEVGGRVQAERPRAQAGEAFG